VREAGKLKKILVAYRKASISFCISNKHVAM